MPISRLLKKNIGYAYIVDEFNQQMLDEIVRSDGRCGVLGTRNLYGLEETENRFPL